MSLDISCPACDRKLRLGDEFLGKTVRCSACGHVFRTPDGPPAVAVLVEEAVVPPPPLPARATRPAPVRDEPPSSRRREPDIAILSFRVQVKDPDEEFSGRLPAKVTREGLWLTSRGRDVLLPVGCEARFLRSNVLSVYFKGRDIQLTVFQYFGTLYWYRLARDVAEFLDGGRADFHGADYRIPWYLIVLPLLPAGLMIFGIAGVLVAMGMCFLSTRIVHHERWPVATRVAVCSLIAVGTYVAYGTLVALIVSLRMR